MTNDVKNIFSALFLIAGAMAVIIGFYYTYNPEKIMGGEAYNYTIAASRGIVWVGLGIFFGIVSLWFRSGNKTAPSPAVYSKAPPTPTPPTP